MFTVLEFFAHPKYPEDYDGGKVYMGADIALAVVELDFKLDKKGNLNDA